MMPPTTGPSRMPPTIAGTCMIVALMPVGIGMNPRRLAPRKIAIAARTAEITMPRVDSPPCPCSNTAAPPIGWPGDDRPSGPLPADSSRPGVPPAAHDPPWRNRAGESERERRAEHPHAERKRGGGRKPVPRGALQRRVRRAPGPAGVRARLHRDDQLLAPPECVGEQRHDDRQQPPRAVDDPPPAPVEPSA